MTPAPTRRRLTAAWEDVITVALSLSTSSRSAIASFTVPSPRSEKVTRAYALIGARETDSDLLLEIASSPPRATDMVASRRLGTESALGDVVPVCQEGLRWLRRLSSSNLPLPAHHSRSLRSVIRY